MAKLYIFGIGGTASRVLKSLTMLLASGVKCDINTIVPIIIDRDKGNGDLSKTHGLIKNYISVSKFAPKRDPLKKIANSFFNTEIKLLGDELLLKLDDQTQKFEDFIGLDTQTSENKALSKILFSKNTLEMDTEHGFKGNPNIGSVVLNQFDDKNIFKQFASDFQDGDKIFIISSIFGGTGASGFPLLRKMLQSPNLKDGSGAQLPNWGLINTAPIGAISVLPYFNVDRKDNVDSDTFNDKTRAALSYYENENGKLDTLYYIADTNRRAYKYAEGGKAQENDAHFVELAAAMSILDFVNDEKSTVNFKKDSYGIRQTTFKEFGINNDVPVIGFENLSAETQKLLVNPLSRFMLFLKYLGYTIVKKQENGLDKYIAQRVDANDILSVEAKYQPYARKRFIGDFRNKIADLETIQRLFLDWLQEMGQQSRKFAPFNLNTPNAFDFVSGKISLFKKTDFRYKNWSIVDNELNSQISKLNTSLTNEAKFIELFYRTTEALINQTTQAGNTDKKTYAFRLQQDGDFGLINTIEHWGVSDAYGEKQRAAIKSSNKSSENQPTSIPSPFARIALTKTAFEEVAAYNDLALNAYQKIVSDTLDVAEIFFTFDKWKNEIEIIEWNKEGGLQQLENHKILHKTLRTFIKTDAQFYNFDRMKSLYILKHKEKGEIIGATSPCTLFVSSANSLQNLKIKIGGDRMAFDEIKPLNARTWEFQKYLYTWLAANDESRQVSDKPVSIFAEFKSYLEGQRQIAIINGRNASDFEILDANFKLSHYKSLRSPDVEIIGKSVHYHNFNEAHGKIEEYLTTDDLLDSKIIRLPYGIQKESFFDGNLNENSRRSYLLPIKEEFFRHYTTSDLKKFAQINDSGDVAVVALKINGREYKKEYKKSVGEIVDHNFDFALFPNIKFKESESAHYRFGLVAEFDESEKYELSYLGIDRENTILKAIIRNVRDGNYSKCNHYILERTNFEYLQVAYEDARGIILPSFERTDDGSKSINIAIDLGTTSTHVVCEINNSAQTLAITSLDKQINVLSKDADRLVKYELIFDSDLIPQTIGDTTKFSFPIRTALSEATSTDWQGTTYAMANANIPFDYEKRPTYDYNTITPNLKWSNDNENTDRVKTYIESLFLILRNKVILIGGDLRTCKIVWFYPISMTHHRFNLFRAEWESAFQKYFSSNVENIIPMTESIAPYEFYKDSVNGLSSMASIDIGGGTTDIAIGRGKDVQHIVSFRFAANSIFGNGYATNQHGRIQNGIIRQFKDKIKDVLTANKLDDLLNVYNEMDKKNDSAEMASFIFSLTGNKAVLDENVEDKADLNKLLQIDGKQKIIFIFFYSAIIYHLAQILKAKELSMPRYITFSGNGAKVISILSNNTDTLTKFTRRIFEKVLNQKDLGEMTIFYNSKSPKEVTCKGGISCRTPEDYDAILNKKIVLLEHNHGKFVADETYKGINQEETIQTATREAREFIKLVLDLNSEFSFKKNFGVDAASIEIAERQLRSDDLLNFTRSGLEQKLTDVSESEKIEETFFFYPLTGMLYDLSNKIFDLQTKG